MDQNCNLELRLSSSPSFSDHDSDNRRLNQLCDDGSSKNSHQMTIFYNGRVCVANFTKDQAKAILILATKQMEKRSVSPRLESIPVSPELFHHGAASGLSMQRSLQGFLQKRKKRIQSASPYHQ